jgi:hypothetical protein
MTAAAAAVAGAVVAGADADAAVVAAAAGLRRVGGVQRQAWGIVSVGRSALEAAASRRAAGWMGNNYGPS